MAEARAEAEVGAEEEEGAEMAHLEEGRGRVAIGDREEGGGMEAKNFVATHGTNEMKASI